VCKIIQSLFPASTDEEFDKFGACFAIDTKAWLKNMNEYPTPSIGRQGPIDKLRSIMTEKYWKLAERKAISSAVTADGSRLFVKQRSN